MAVFTDPEMQEIFEGFLIETNELLESITTDIVEVENNPDDLDLINKLFRSFHTIKGTASFMGFNDISGITHHAEDILNKLRKEELKVTQAIIDVLLEVQDWIVFLLEKVQSEDDSPVDYSETIAKIDVIRNSQAGASEEKAAPPAEQQEQETPKEEVQAQEESESEAQQEGRAVDQVFAKPELVEGSEGWTDEEMQLIDAAFLDVNADFWEEQKGNSGSESVAEEKVEDSQEVAAKVEETPAAAETSSTAAKVEEAPTQDVQATTTNSSAAKEEVPATTAPNAPSAPTSNVPKKPNSLTAKSMKSSADTTIRVDVSRVESIMDLSGELVLNRNRLLQLSEYLASDISFEVFKESVKDLLDTATSIDTITSEIQGAAMKMRMVPVGKLYQKAPRIVRDLSKESKKKINLIVKGEETEIDRGIIEELTDPLTHMIRNSCDHGIELPEDRIAAGKPETGTIILDAEQEGNSIVLKITDDGKGMDAEFLKQRAIEKGVITVEQAANMSKRDALQLIFAPGFSTAAKVTSVSGRGVGMDVVRTNIADLKGFIDIETEIGKGTTFFIKLPLTLAIIQGLIVVSGKERFAIPLNSVLNVVSVDSHSIYTLNQVEVIRIREDVIPLLRLDEALDVPDKKESMKDSYVVIVGVGSQQIGIVVDTLLGQQEVVIKSLGEYLGTIKAISGSTIMGDGSVIMIVDIAELVQIVYETNKITKKDLEREKEKHKSA